MKNTKKVADQLLAVVGRIIGVGHNLNAITSSMLDAADNAAVDARGLDHASDILAWAGWTGEVTSDILGAVDGLLCAVHDLIGSNRERGAQARQRAASREVRNHG
jgi:hypothetical protein